MRLHPYTAWIISVGAVICGVDGIFTAMRIHDRTWIDWVVTLGGMILAGAVSGFLVALVMTISFKYLWLPSALSRSLRNPRKKISRK